MKEQIEFKDFLEIEKKLEIKVGKILTVEKVEKSDKLLKLTVDFGDDIRTVVTNIKPYLKGYIESIVNLKFLFITNLKVVKMMGIESSAMIMPGQVEEGKLITCSGEIGTKLL